MAKQTYHTKTLITKSIPEHIVARAEKIILERRKNGKAVNKTTFIGIKNPFNLSMEFELIWELNGKVVKHMSPYPLKGVTEAIDNEVEMLDNLENNYNEKYSAKYEEIRIWYYPLEKSGHATMKGRKTYCPCKKSSEKLNKISGKLPNFGANFKRLI